MTAAEPLFLGVDGGGTRCRARIRDVAGRLVGEGEAGPANVRRGAAGAIGSAVAAATAALTAGGLGKQQIGRLRAGLGLAGACQRAGRAAALAEPHPFASLILTTDFAAACLGAHGGGDGGVVIVGTGSVAYAMIGGREARFGGWGFEASDDGGGAALGRAALRHALRAFDGLEPRGPLACAALEAVGGDPDAAVEWLGTASPASFGALAPLVFAHAGADEAAERLAQASAAAAAELVLRLKDWGVDRVALIGGLAEAHRPRLPQAALDVLVPPQGDACEGALSLARPRTERAA